MMYTMSYCDHRGEVSSRFLAAGWLRSFLSRRIRVDLDSSAAALGLLLGLGNLNARNLCSGYSHACPCVECKARAENVSPEFVAWLEGRGSRAVPELFTPPKRVLQPWEQAA